MKKYKKDDIAAGINTTFKEFFTAVVALLSYDKKIKELNYIRTPITLPNGGVYLISILHIDGPKIDMDLLRSVADSQVANSKTQEKSNGSENVP